MKFTDKDLGTHTLIRIDNLKPCNVCKELTQYIDYYYEVRCCSVECENILDNNYKDWIDRMLESENNE